MNGDGMASLDHTMAGGLTLNTRAYTYICIFFWYKGNSRSFEGFVQNLGISESLSFPRFQDSKNFGGSLSLAENAGIL